MGNRLPASETYNDLNGDEIKSILRERFSQVLELQPFLRRHLTLPRVRMKLRVEFEQWADAASPELLTVDDAYALVNEVTVDSSPTPGGGQPPDQIRIDHALPVTRPSAGPVETGEQVVTSDRAIAGTVGLAPKLSLSDIEIRREPRVGEVADGYKFAAENPATGPSAGIEVREAEIPAMGVEDALRVDRTGEAKMYHGQNIVRGARGTTTGTLDPGPAGLARGVTNRTRLDTGTRK